MDPPQYTALVTEMSDWYYGKGGMYLSKNARGLYLFFMDQLERASSSPTALDDTRRRSLFESASELRTQITADVGTRKPPLYTRP